MKAFRYSTPATLYFGRNCIKDHFNAVITPNKRTYVITSQFAEGCENKGLNEITALLDENGFEYEIYDRVEENPAVEQVKLVADITRKFAPESIIAIGGGSVIDMAKAVSCILPFPGKDPYEHFFTGGQPFGDKENKTSVPVFSVPTTAGTGADVTGGAVLTRADTDTKLSISQFVCSKASFIDPRYIEDSPYFLLDTGAMDALAHGIETCINVNCSHMGRKVAKIGFELFAEYKEALLNKTLDGEDFDKMAAAASIIGMSFMQAGTCLPHGMSYPLSHHKGLNHGLGCAIFLGEYVKSIKDTSLVLPYVQQCGFETIDEFAAYCKEITNRNVDIEVTEAELNDWADEFAALKYRLARHPEPITRDEIYRIYHDSLEKYIVK